MPADGGRTGRSVFLPWDILMGTLAVLERDFLVFTSVGRFLVLRTVVVLVPAVAFAIVVGFAYEHSVPPSELGKLLFQTSLVIVPPLLLLMAPALAAPAIVTERALVTLPLVLAAPIRPLAFVLAKFLSRLGVVCILFLGIVPMAALCLLFGGVSFDLFVSFLYISAAAALTGIATGTLASAYSRRVPTAVLTSYFLAIGVPLILLGLLALVAEATDMKSATALTLARPNLFVAWVELIAEGVGRGRAATGPWIALVTSMVATVVCLLLAWMRIAREGRSPARKRNRVRRIRPVAFANPVFDRAIRGSLLRSPTKGAWAILAVGLTVELLILGLAAGERDLDEEWPHLVAPWILIGIAAIVLLAHTAYSIASERHSGALELLSATPVGDRRIVDGKLGGALAAVAPIVVLASVHSLVAVAYSDHELRSWAAFQVTSIAILALFAMVGMWNSCTARTGGKAVLVTFAWVFGGMVVHAVAVALLALVTQWSLDELYLIPMAATPPFLACFPAAVLEDNYIGSDEKVGLVASAIWMLAYFVAAGWMWALLPWRLRRGEQDADGDASEQEIEIESGLPDSRWNVVSSDKL